VRMADHRRKRRLRPRKPFEQSFEPPGRAVHEHALDSSCMD
jgi:hypothetical protein